MQICSLPSFLLRGLGALTIVFTLTAPLPAQSAAPLLVTQAIDDTVRTRLPGNVHPLARSEFDRGEAPADLPLKRMLLVLKRSPEQESALRRLIDNQQDKNSFSYHQWVTPQDFGAHFGPSDYDMAAVTNWLMAGGFEINQVSNGRTVIEFSGTAGLVKRAFGTAIHKFVAQGEEHWANVNDPSIPTALVPVVAGLVSLHNFEKKAQNHLLGTYSEESKKLNSPQPDYTFNGGCTQNGNCYALVPYDFATIYDLLPLWNATPTKINGTGQIIAIVGRTAIDPTDPPTFWSLFGLDGVNAPQPTLVITPNGPMPGINGDEPEADIDIQWSGAAAPGATINFVTSATTETTDGVDLSALYIVNNNVAHVMSESYGLCEAFLGTGGVTFYGLLWEQAAAQGISAMVSTGDNSAAGCDNPGFPAQLGLNVNGLASTPFNVAVGGTDFNQFTTDPLTYWNQSSDPITHKSAKGYIPETTWNDSCANPLFQFVGGTTNPETNCNNPNFSIFLNSAGGSGGKSTDWTKPSWQTGTPNDNARDLPDISLFASDGFLASFYIICVKDLTGGVCDLNNFAGFGGTSVASPAFAGIMALVNQKWGAQGNPNFVLYKLPAKQANAFHDTPSGSTIAVPCFKGSPNCTTQNQAHQFGLLSGFSTGTAYDLATGLGSVDAANMVNNWNKVTFSATTTTLTLNSGNAVNVTHGAAVPVTVSVTPTSATGDIALLVSPGTPGDPGIDFNTLGAGGTKTWSTNLLPGGTYKVIAHYAGDGTRGGSYSAPSPNVTVNPENSSVFMPGVVIGTDSNGNPVYSATVAYGSIYLLRADVVNSQGNICTTATFGEIACPTGSVAFTDNGNPVDAGTYKLNSFGYTEDDVIQLPGGSHPLSGAYSGDASYKASTGTVTVTVTKASTGINNLSAPATANTGQQFTVTATVTTSSSGVAPSGAVVFLANGNPLPGAVQLSPVDGNFQTSAALGASLSTAINTPGTYNITATYSGDGNYASVATSNQAQIVVSTPVPDFTLSVSANPNQTLVNQNVTWFGTVTAVNGYNKSVALSCLVGAPGTCIISPPSVSPNGGQSSFSLTVGSATTGTFSFNIQGTDGTLTHAQGVLLFVNQDFSVPANLSPPPAASPGQTTSTTMMITTLGHATFNDNVTYTCSGGLPAGATCTFSPMQISINDPATQVQITVATKGPFTGAAGSARRKLFGQRRLLWLPLGLPLAGLVFVGLFGGRLPRRQRLVGLCLAVTAFAFLLACGGGSNSPPPPPPVSVSVSPGTVNTLYPNLAGAPAQTQPFAATVSHANNTAVTWAVTGGDANGTVDASGLYSAPPTVPTGPIHVTATSQADPTKSGSATVNIQAPTPSGIYPVTVTMSEASVQHTTTFNLSVQ